MLMDIQKSHQLETFKHQLMHEQTKRSSSMQPATLLSQRATKSWCPVITQKVLQKPRAKWDDPDATDHMCDST